MDEENGQAGSELAPVDDFAGLVALLRDNPEADAATDQPSDDGARVPAKNADDEPLDGVIPDDERQPSQSDEDDAKGKQAVFKVPVKGADGADTTIEVSEKELIAGYQRHADYTRKAQELSTQRAQVMGIADQRINESHAQALDSIQKTHAAITRLAQIPSLQEMAALAARDPQAAFAEQARVSAVNAELAALDQLAAENRAALAKAEKEALERAFVDCWTVLNANGITEKPVLAELFKNVQSMYGIEESRFTKISDPKLILLMRDAVQLRQLKARAATDAGKKLLAAPKLPPARQSLASSAKANRELDGRFKSRHGGSVNDLAAWLDRNERPRASR